jgi:hypothetical protein
MNSAPYSLYTFSLSAVMSSLRVQIRGLGVYSTLSHPLSLIVPRIIPAYKDLFYFEFLGLYVSHITQMVVVGIDHLLHYVRTAE